MSKMKPEIKKLWVDALRSDQYEQGAGQLRYGDSFCCLGVLCDLAVKAGVRVDETHKEDFDNDDTPVYAYDGEEATPPDSVTKWAGITFDPELIDNGESFPITELNDNYGLNFNEIADLIDEQL